MTTVDQLKTTLRCAFNDAPDRELAFKAMFGGACAHVNRRVFASLSNVGLELKIDPQTARAWLQEGEHPLQYEEDAPISQSYVVAAQSILNDQDELARWVEQSVEFVLLLPAKRSKRHSE